MVYRKGELSKNRIDREWPHQVEVHADVCAGPNYKVVDEFCRGLSVCPRGGRGGWKEDGWYNRYAFSSAADAEAFQQRFGGRRLTVRFKGNSTRPIDDFGDEPTPILPASRHAG